MYDDEEPAEAAVAVVKRVELFDDTDRPRQTLLTPREGVLSNGERVEYPGHRRRVRFLRFAAKHLQQRFVGFFQGRRRLGFEAQKNMTEEPGVGQAFCGRVELAQGRPSLGDRTVRRGSQLGAALTEGVGQERMVTPLSTLGGAKALSEAAPSLLAWTSNVSWRCGSTLLRGD